MAHQCSGFSVCQLLPRAVQPVARPIRNFINNNSLCFGSPSTVQLLRCWCCCGLCCCCSVRPTSLHKICTRHTGHCVAGVAASFSSRKAINSKLNCQPTTEKLFINYASDEGPDKEQAEHAPRGRRGGGNIRGYIENNKHKQYGFQYCRVAGYHSVACSSSPRSLLCPAMDNIYSLVPIL